MRKLPVVGMLFMVFCCVLSAYALNLDKIKSSLLNGDYKQAILEGEKMLASEPKAAHSDELYYILGLSYMKDGNYLRASDIFEILINEFKDSDFKQEARLGLADTSFLRGDLPAAKDRYKSLLGASSSNRIKALAYSRLAKVCFKSGDTEEAKEYLDKLKKDFPLSDIADESIEPAFVRGANSDIYYTVQIGSFSKQENANNLAQKLAKQGYPAYIEESQGEKAVSYRVRIGKLPSRQEAVNLERKLAQEGYPTKVFP